MMMGDRSSPDLVVGPRCQVQTPAKRFGAHAVEKIREFVSAPYASNSAPFDDDQEDDSGGDSDPGDSPADIFAAAALSASTSNDSENAGSQDDDGQDEVEPPSSHHRVPHLARARSNLTALSRHYNLYAAAYQDEIYVYQPQRAPQILPSVSLILRPPPSRLGKLTGGVLDRSFPHQVNYVTVGDLGDHEILLLAFDDGDVIAYYTHLIAQAIGERNSPHGSNAARAVPRPFFEANVGASAWGLAIHTHSRLIAASSNRHDVTVFAFAMAQRGKQSDETVQTSAKPWSLELADVEKHFRSRTRMLRIVLPIGFHGGQSPHNIPSIAFCDDDRGDAEKVVAVDIHGNTWLLDIWKLGGPATVVKPTRDMTGLSNPGSSYIGWSVLVLPNSSFKPAASNHAAMGLPANEILRLNNSTGDGVKNDVWLDITNSLRHVEDNAANVKDHLSHRFYHTYESLMSQSGSLVLPGTGFNNFDTPIPSDDDTDDDAPLGPPDPLLSSDTSGVKQHITQPDAQVRTVDSTLDSTRHNQLCFGRLALTVVPSTNQLLPTLTRSQLLAFINASNMREQQIKVVELRNVRLPSFLAANFSILRTTTTGVELQSLDPKSTSVLCREILPHHNHHSRRNSPWDLNPGISERVTMSLHVPELGLVVIGSLNGRVALLSLTKPPNKHGFGPRLSGATSAAPGGAVRIRRAFRVEAVLPRRRDEQARLRPWCTLHGIAISPVPSSHATGLDLLSRGCRVQAWRLILHYLDHTILMYDISRHDNDGGLLII